MATASPATVDRAGLAAAQTPQGVRRALLRDGVRALPAGRPRDLDRRSRPAGGLYHSRPCDRRRPRQPQGDRARGPRPRGAASSGRHRGRAIGIGHDRHPFGPGAPLVLGGIDDRRARRGSPATPTATSRSTRSPTRCSAPPVSAISGGCSRPDRRRPRGIASADSSARSSDALAGDGLAARRRRPHDRRRPAAARRPTSPAMRAADRRAPRASTRPRSA